MIGIPSLDDAIARPTRCGNTMATVPYDEDLKPMAAGCYRALVPAHCGVCGSNRWTEAAMACECECHAARRFVG